MEKPELTLEQKKIQAFDLNEQIDYLVAVRNQLLGEIRQEQMEMMARKQVVANVPTDDREISRGVEAVLASAAQRSRNGGRKK